MSRNKSFTIHYIGKVIATRQLSCARANIDSIRRMNTGLMDQIESEEYADRAILYILLKQNMLEFLFKKYEVEGETKRSYYQ